MAVLENEPLLDKTGRFHSQLTSAGKHQGTAVRDHSCTLRGCAQFPLEGLQSLHTCSFSSDQANAIQPRQLPWLELRKLCEHCELTTERPFSALLEER